MATNASTPLQRAYAAIRQKLKALAIAEDAIIRLIDEELIDTGYGNLKLNEISSERSDLMLEQQTLDTTGTVTHAISQEDVERLAQAVQALQQRNVSAAALQGIISEAVIIARTAAGG